MKAAGGIKLFTMRSLTFAHLAVSTAMQVFAAEAQVLRGRLDFHQDDESRTK
jgi:hypothetical protein